MSTQNTRPLLLPTKASILQGAVQLLCTHFSHCLALFSDSSHFSFLGLIFFGLMSKNILLLSDKKTQSSEWLYSSFLSLIHKWATRITKQLVFYTWSLSSHKIFSYFRGFSGFSILCQQHDLSF